MPKLKKTLPKDLDELLEAAAESGDESTVRRALEKCDPNAYVRGYGKTSLLMNRRCSFELAHWVLERGADIDATNTWGRTALHESCASRFHHLLTPEQLIELGADVHQVSSYGNTPLHSAADGKNLKAVQVLLSYGANVQARDNSGQTPLEYALKRMRNIDFLEIVKVSKALLDAGAEVSEEARKSVSKAAETFEFHREAYNKEHVDECSEAMLRLCTMFGVERPQQRKIHDGVSPIVATASGPGARHAELWEFLVPSSGPCQTVQGEVIRIAGRVKDEWDRNGGANWDRDYSRMAKAFLEHLSSGESLETSELELCHQVIKNLSSEPEESERLIDWSQQWVTLNPNPVPLRSPGYDR